MAGRTGAAMMDGRDGEALAAAHGPEHDNGVRYPQHIGIEHNVFHDFGVWDKQCAAFTKHLAPFHGTFKNNVAFNSSRHGINYQDGVGGGGLLEGK